nr:hypothetical protein [Desulfobacterales bacterium]
MKRGCAKVSSCKPAKFLALTMEERPLFQVVWGIILASAGLGVILRIPYVFPLSSGFTFKHLSFYILGGILFGGGLKKLYTVFFTRRIS